ALVRKAKSSNVKLKEVEKFDTEPGMGVSAFVEGKKVLVGNRKYLENSGIQVKDVDEIIRKLEAGGKTVVLVAVELKLAGIIGIADALKETSAKAVKILKAMGIGVVMMTGDNPITAKAIAGQLGIEKVLAGILPAGKSEEVQKLQKKGQVVAFVGDGINDAPALARADVGIAIGTGTDVAIESGDIVLVKGDLLDAAGAIQLSRKVMGRIQQNVFWAFAYNMALIPVAAGALYPLWGITFKPELAGLAMAMSSVTVISLSLLLKKFIPSNR
ncbi:MAG: HAD-IC family P-type ATPase, partial [Thermoplasmata archaeon]|nr:HAD-IC family P-type ATPase [Thermoplasmata archaeon]